MRRGLHAMAAAAALAAPLAAFAQSLPEATGTGALARFTGAFSEICLGSLSDLPDLPDLASAPERLKAAGWEGDIAAAAGQWEFYEGNAWLMLETGKSGVILLENGEESRVLPGCTMLDPELPYIKAHNYLQSWVADHGADNWEMNQEENGYLVWRMTLDKWIVQISLSHYPDDGGGTSANLELLKPVTIS